MTSYRSSLASIAPACREPDDSHARAAAAAAWHQTGIILINPAWLTSWADRKQAELLAELLFGKREKKDGEGQ